MEGLLLKLENALKTANEDALESVSARHSGTGLTLNTKIGYSQSAAHPLLAKLRISPADMKTMEDFSENIQNSQTEKNRNTLVDNKGPTVPLKTPRCVELMVTECQHRMWAAGNTNLMTSSYNNTNVEDLGWINGCGH
jgi:hypothetical protein